MIRKFDTESAHVDPDELIDWLKRTELNEFGFRNPRTFTRERCESARAAYYMRVYSKAVLCEINKARARLYEDPLPDLDTVEILFRFCGLEYGMEDRMLWPKCMHAGFLARFDTNVLFGQRVMPLPT